MRLYLRMLMALALVSVMTGSSCHDENDNTTDDTAQEAAPAEESHDDDDGGGGGGGSGSSQFLWKPVSESDGKLVVLLPSTYAPTVGVGDGKIVNGAGATLEVGVYGGTYEDGRPAYRFSQAGAAYGAGIFFKAYTGGGVTEIQSWSIPDGSQRTVY